MDASDTSLIIDAEAAKRVYWEKASLLALPNPFLRFYTYF